MRAERPYESFSDESLRRYLTTQEAVVSDLQDRMKAETRYLMAARKEQAIRAGNYIPRAFEAATEGWTRCVAVGPNGRCIDTAYKGFDLCPEHQAEAARKASSTPGGAA